MLPGHIADEVREVGKTLGPLRTGLEKIKSVCPTTGESLYPLCYPGFGAVSISTKISNFRNITHTHTHKHTHTHTHIHTHTYTHTQTQSMTVTMKIHTYIGSSRLSNKGNFEIYTIKDILNITFYTASYK